RVDRVTNMERGTNKTAWKSFTVSVAQLDEVGLAGRSPLDRASRRDRGRGRGGEALPGAGGARGTFSGRRRQAHASSFGGSRPPTAEIRAWSARGQVRSQSARSRHALWRRLSASRFQSPCAVKRFDVSTR